MKICLRRMTALTSLLTATFAGSTAAIAQDGKASEDTVAHAAIMVTASKPEAFEIGGSVQYLDSEDLAEFSYTDSNRLLRQVPGVNLQEEDGYGLRPNIGIRGSGSDRSGRIALMEDGVLIAPAPYAAPSAYYFPQIGRMSAVELSKGPAAIKYGPMTVGGALNLISTPIPSSAAGYAEVLAGTDNAVRAHGWAGGWTGLSSGLEAGALVEGLYERTDGFKAIDIGGDTGFEISDFVAKLGLRTTDGVHSLGLKVQAYDETSSETYLGLTLDDFNASPFRRYNASQRDEMNAEHQTYQLTYRYQPTDDLGLTVVAYRNDTKRSWYKLNDVRNSADTGWVSISRVLADPSTYADQMADIIGAADYVGGDTGLRVRNNNRTYRATGVQAVFQASFATGALSHELEVSARYHEDDEDRFQQDDLYQMAGGQMLLTSAGAPGSSSNRLGEARAWAFYVSDTLSYGNLSLTPGLRYEAIDLTRTDWSTSDPDRTSPTSVRESDLDVWIPGVALSWKVADGVRVIAGAHRGFASPGPGSTADAETSWNYEAGIKVDQGAWRAEAVGYFNDYSNLLGTCTNSTGGDCTIGDQFDGGAVEVKGIELTGGYTFGSVAQQGFAVPVSLVYTLTDATFDTSFDSDYEAWGTVTKGDELPYLPEHQLTLNAGVELESLRLSATINLVSEARSVAGQGDIAASQKIDGRALVDLAAEWDLAGPVSLFASVTNLFDKVYNVSFSPAGARPGAPRLVMGGVRARF